MQLHQKQEDIVQKDSKIYRVESREVFKGKSIVCQRAIEYKQKLTDSLEKEIVAFLNYKNAGVVYMGIDSSGETVGCKSCDEL